MFWLVDILIEMGVMVIEVDELESERVKFIYVDRLNESNWFTSPTVRES